MKRLFAILVILTLVIVAVAAFRPPVREASQIGAPPNAARTIHPGYSRPTPIPGAIPDPNDTTLDPRERWGIVLVIGLTALTVILFVVLSGIPRFGKWLRR